MEDMLAMDLIVTLQDGQKKRVHDLTMDELLHEVVYPPVEEFLGLIFLYRAAREGFVHLGGGEFKHIDELSLEDLLSIDRC